MAETDWLLVGLVVGVLVGIPLGYMLTALFKPKEAASVVFERDKEGKIGAIHYVPVGAKG